MTPDELLARISAILAEHGVRGIWYLTLDARTGDQVLTIVVPPAGALEARFVDGCEV